MTLSTARNGRTTVSDSRTPSPSAKAKRCGYFSWPTPWAARSQASKPPTATTTSNASSAPPSATAQLSASAEPVSMREPSQKTNSSKAPTDPRWKSSPAGPSGPTRSSPSELLARVGRHGARFGLSTDCVDSTRTYALEFDLATIFELETGACDQVLRRGGDEHFAGTGRCGDAGAHVDCDAAWRAAGRPFDLAS